MGEAMAVPAGLMEDGGERWWLLPWEPPEIGGGEHNGACFGHHGRRRGKVGVGGKARLEKEGEIQRICVGRGTLP